MWLFLFLFFFQAQVNSDGFQASQAQAEPPTLIVQAVDPSWIPIPNARVTVQPLGANAQLKASHAATDKDGYASFSVPRDADYAIEAESRGFKPGHVSPVHLFKTSGATSPAYVQIRLRLGPPPPTVD